ncbi:MAG: type II secretion system protein [Oscillospiraceae bacterium]|nr:type II secretion system protein [Oscillospiraceae bacterium]
MNRTKSKLKGFTLLELIIVLAILGVLAAVLVPSILGYIRSNRIDAANKQAQQIFMAAQDYLVSEQVKGIKPTEIAANPNEICWIVVTTSNGVDSTQYDKSNKTHIVWSSNVLKDTDTSTPNNDGYDQRVNPDDGTTMFPIADGIEGRLEPGFTGSWAVAYYPATFTVAYAVYNDFYSTQLERENAVKYIGTNNLQAGNSCDDKLYFYTYDMGGSTTQTQELDYANPDPSATPHLYTGQYPVPGPTL